MKPLIAAPFAIVALAMPSVAAAPQFQGIAPIAFMQDLSSGAVLYQRDADRRMPPASMAKMMTVYVAFDMIKKGELKLDQMITVRPETWAKWHGPQAGSTMFLSPNENVSVENLLKGIRLGLTNSHFGTANGWPDNGVTYVTARDLAHLATATIQDFPDLYKRFYSLPNFTWGKTLGAGADITQANRDPLLGRVAGADGLKTGHTEEAGYGFTGSAEQNGRRLVMVVAGLTSSKDRAEESVRFMEWGFRAWQAKPVVAAGKQVSTAEVQMGSSSNVGLVAPRQLTVTLPAGAVPQMSAKVVYEGPIKAPITKGQHIADLVVTSPDLPEQRLPLVADKDVGQAGFFGRAWAGLTSFFG
ncbi:hypothetical protein WR25_04188 [Diploscapter pachys]|uniref:Peptidase S11 D-Ala-D-Ala carboxypeptidase A C-terminal domain-containing protein n=1 Tax=Diploscapter pachys TaxID=2018661 RepID=A0A2A2K3W9_9BILA|nr:hypothetical protein WR25_04188 [Diploscapter pachys]